MRVQIEHGDNILWEGDLNNIPSVKDELLLHGSTILQGMSYWVVTHRTWYFDPKMEHCYIVHISCEQIYNQINGRRPKE